MTALSVDLDALAALAEAATPGPWLWTETSRASLVTDPSGEVARADLATDGEFIASANPAVVAALVRAVRAAQAHLAFTRCSAYDLREALTPFAGEEAE